MTSIGKLEVLVEWTWTPSVPSLAARPAEPAANCLQIDVGFPRLRTGAGIDGGRIRTIGRRDHLFRQGIFQRTDHNVDNALAGVRARRAQGAGAMQFTRVPGSAIISQTFSTPSLFGTSGSTSAFST